MKYCRYYHRVCCLTVALLVALTVHAQIKVSDSTFKPYVAVGAATRTNLRLTTSDTIPLQDAGIIYALSIDATVTLPRESSFCRIVLEDKEGRNYLVAETDRFRNDSETVQLDNYCEETALLEGITPLRLKCYLSGDASVNITGIHTSSHQPERSGSDIQSAKTELRTAQVQSIVDSINAYNIRNGKLWRAGVTDYSLRTIEERCDIGAADPYVANMIYYVCGIYEVGERLQTKTTYQSPYVDSFDWRNRHGKNWITSVKNQSTGGSCWAFAAVAVTEAIANLYYNQNIDYDLAEQEVVSCSGCGTNAGGGNQASALAWISNHGVSEETSFPFSNSDEPCSNKGEYGELLSFVDTGVVYGFRNDFDKIKNALIHYGPVLSGFRFYSAGYHGHAMPIVGYSTIHAGDTIWFFDSYAQSPTSNYVVQSGDSRIGNTCWIFKNSYGTNFSYDLHGYMYVLFNDPACMFTPHYAKTPVSSLIYSDTDIIVEDRDGDGYFNWGIGQRPSNVPSWAAQEEDGDDSDDRLGPMNQYGYSYPLSVGGSTFTITNPITVSNDSYMRNHIRITGNGALTLTSTMRCYRGVRLTIESGTSLIIDGGCLSNIIIDAKVGSTIRLLNGGVILTNKNSPFELPNGAVLEIDNGDIIKYQQSL